MTKKKLYVLHLNHSEVQFYLHKQGLVYHNCPSAKPINMSFFCVFITTCCFAVFLPKPKSLSLTLWYTIHSPTSVRLACQNDMSSMVFVTCVSMGQPISPDRPLLLITQGILFPRGSLWSFVRGKQERSLPCLPRNRSQLIGHIVANHYYRGEGVILVRSGLG